MPPWLLKSTDTDLKSLPWEEPLDPPLLPGSSMLLLIRACYRGWIFLSNRIRDCFMSRLFDGDGVYLQQSELALNISTTNLLDRYATNKRTVTRVWRELIWMICTTS